MGVLYDNSLIAFLVVTILLGGGGGFMTGRALARGWKPYPLLVFYCLLLSLVARFLHFALYEGQLLSLYYLVINFIIITAIAFIGFRMQRSKQMATQYRWLTQ